MKDRYTEFRLTPFGRRLVEIAENPLRYAEFAALSRAGVPAITALVHELIRDFPELRTDDFAKQAVGAFVGNVMREHGHRLLRRGRVTGGLFLYGALWSAFPEDEAGSAALVPEAEAAVA
jgi:hypothetical protein